MNELTKQQRHEVYKEALNIFNSKEGCVYLCENLRESVSKLVHIKFSNESYDKIIDMLPEFKNKKPKFKNKKPKNVWRAWFHGSEERINCLNQCIEETR